MRKPSNTPPASIERANCVPNWPVDCLVGWSQRTDNRHSWLLLSDGLRPRSMSATYEPSLAVVARGATGRLGEPLSSMSHDTCLRRWTCRHLQRNEASEEVPYLGFVLKLESRGAGVLSRRDSGR